MTEARCDEIQAILEDWKPEEQPEVRELIQTFARSLGKTPAGGRAAPSARDGVGTAGKPKEVIVRYRELTGADARQAIDTVNGL